MPQACHVTSIRLGDAVGKVCGRWQGWRRHIRGITTTHARYQSSVISDAAFKHLAVSMHALQNRELHRSGSVD